MRSAGGGCTYVFCLDIVSLQRIVRGTTVGWSAGIEDGAEMITLGERDGNDSMHQQGGAATTEEEREASGAKRRCTTIKTEGMRLVNICRHVSGCEVHLQIMRADVTGSLGVEE